MTQFTVTGAGFLGGLRAELMKTRRRWSPWIVLAVNVVVLIGFSYVIEWVIYTYVVHASARVNPAELKMSLHPSGFAYQALSTNLAPVLATILGVLVVGNEFGSGTLKTLFTIRPARLEVLAAKYVALLIAVAIGVVVTFAAAALTSVILAEVDHVSLNNWPTGGSIVEAMLGALLVWSWWAFFGGTLAIVFRNMAAAIGIGLAWSLVVEDLVLTILGQVGGSFWDAVRKGFPGANASALAGVFRPTQFAESASRAGSVPSASVGAGQATLVLVAYAVVALIVSFAVVARRDVT